MKTWTEWYEAIGSDVAVIDEIRRMENDDWAVRQIVVNGQTTIVVYEQPLPT